MGTLFRFPCVILLSLSAGFALQQHRYEPAIELQPLAAQVRRVVEAMDYLGAPIASQDRTELSRALGASDSATGIAQLQKILDKYCLLEVQINPESRVKVSPSLARPALVEHGWRSFLVKVRNEAGVTAELKASSSNAAPVWVRSTGSPSPKDSVKPEDVRDRWLDLRMFNAQPLNPSLSGLQLEYRIIQLYSRDTGKREAQISFNVGQGTQDIGFRNDASILFECRPSMDVTLRVTDENGDPATGSFVIRDKLGHVYPSQAKRLAPDFAFHPQVYRADGEVIKLPAGEYAVEYSRGPEYLVKKQTIRVEEGQRQSFAFRLERWIDPARQGWYSGDHHIHAAGCLHYEKPTEGVFPQDMMRHILGEDLNVGCVLTWGPCYYFQKQFFEGRNHKLSTPGNLMRYDVEVSGFPSSHAGHLVLLRLKEQDYPNAKRIEDWPTWDLPILKWAKTQGAVVGFAHSGWGLEIKTNQLPNYEMPAFDGIGANEYIVDVAHDAVDFISTVDTPHVWELNIWYHTLNSGFRTRISGETDFPCIYGEKVGLGRSYVKLEGPLAFDPWTEGVRKGRSYVTDGKSHLLDFKLNGQLVGENGSEVRLAKPGTVHLTVDVGALLDEQPNESVRARRYDEKPYWDLERARIGNTREVPVEVVVNGVAVARQQVLADGKIRKLSFEVPIQQSSWAAVRILPSSHTNPFFVLVRDQPIRASRKSIQWCLDAIDQCWKQKSPKISAREIEDARRVYDVAREVYRKRLQETAPE